MQIIAHIVTIRYILSRQNFLTMMWILVILLVLLAILAIILFTPFRVVIHTPSGMAALIWGNAIKARVQVIESRTDLILGLNIFWWRREWSAFRIIAAPRQKETTPQKVESTKRKAKKRRRRPSIRRTGRAILSLVRSFRVRAFRLSIDTGDYATNGILYPFAVLAKKAGFNCSVNFDGTNELILDMSNRPVNILRAWLISRISFTNHLKYSS